MRSSELARWINAWLRDQGHMFRATNLGVPAAICVRCGLVVTARARIFNSEYMWLVDCHDWPAPHRLRRALRVVPDCGLLLVAVVMES